MANKQVNDEDVKALRYYTQSQEYNINLNQARIQTQEAKTTLLYRFMFASMWFIGCIAIYFTIQVYQIYKTFKDLVDITNASGTLGVGGMQIALSLHSYAFSVLFGPSPNHYFSDAVWLLWYDTELRTAVAMNYNPTNATAVVGTDTTITPSMWKSVLVNLLGMAKNTPSANAMKLACMASKASSDSSAGQACFPQCQMPDMVSQDPAIAGAQGAIGMAGAMGGIGMAISGPFGLIGAGIGALIGGITSGISAAKERERQREECEATRTSGTCYWPPTFPSCK